MGVRLRPLTQADVEAVLDLNEREVHLLAPLARERLDQLWEWAFRFDVIEVDGAVGGFGGFVLTIGPGTAYDSENYRWFAETYDRFLYLDRVVLEPHVRRRGVGGVVYGELEAEAARFGRMALEVNADPPNEPSLAFHAARGYVEVGRGGEPGHVVSRMVKNLTPAG